MSLFSVLNVATTGLTASQLGMDVAGQNITNADVDGYSRKRLNTSASYRSDGTYGQMGMGVDVINIQRMRSGFIDDEIRDQTQQVGYYTQIDQTYQNLQSIFTEPSDTGLQEYMDQFFDSWQNLANNPADTSARTMVKTDGEILTNTFHNLASQLEQCPPGDERPDHAGRRQGEPAHQGHLQPQLRNSKRPINGPERQRQS